MVFWHVLFDIVNKWLCPYWQLKSLHERQAELLELQRKADMGEEGATPTSANGSQLRAAYRGDKSQRPVDEDKDKDEREDEEVCCVELRLYW